MIGDHRAIRNDLTGEEWDALQRLNRGPPEANLVPETIYARLAEVGLALMRGGQRRISDRGKRLILWDRDDRLGRGGNPVRSNERDL